MEKDFPIFRQAGTSLSLTVTLIEVEECLEL